MRKTDKIGLINHVQYPPPLGAGQLCLPARLRPKDVAGHLVWECMLFLPTLLGTPRASVSQQGPEDSPPGLCRNSATFHRQPLVLHYNKHVPLSTK